MEAPEYRGGNFQLTPEKHGKDFFVEDLLDFSNEEEVDGGEETGLEEVTGNSTDSSTVTAVDSCNSSFSAVDQLLSGDLCEPYDELAELEWLSNFVEESFSSEEVLKLQLISGVQSSTSSSDATRVPVKSSDGDRITTQPPAANFLPESSVVPGKARSKRSRTAACNWSSRLLVLSPNTGDITSSSSDSNGIPVNVPKKPAAKLSKKRDIGGVGPTLAPSDGRRCLHCATDKTPQWRTGPMGPKTLCNACGVRYKSGRLVSEYRPASSPTFVPSQHSNSHRKVLELRRQKEMQPSLLHVANSVFDAGTTIAGDEFLIHNHLGPDFGQLIEP